MTRQIPLPLPHDEAMGADDFLVTPSNRDAAAWVKKWPDWPAHGLVVTGLSGSGKTHLLNLWLTKTRGRLVTKTELCTSDSASLTAETSSLAFDNVDSFGGDDIAEEALFHLYNHLKASQGWMLLTMSHGVGHAGFVLPDLRSRLLTLPTASLAAPDDLLLEALIVKQFRDRQVTMDAGVISYIASHAARDAASIRSLVERLDHEGLSEGRKITIGMARKILGNGEN